jgi:predicted DNA binding CopG/RHH family protein
MKTPMLSKREKALEKALLGGAYKSLGKAEVSRVVQAIARRKKDAVLNIRVNTQDLTQIKKKAARLGIPYQTYISEFIHQLAI